jgi:hypothetical protein
MERIEQQIVTLNTNCFLCLIVERLIVVFYCNNNLQPLFCLIAQKWCRAFKKINVFTREDNLPPPSHTIKLQRHEEFLIGIISEAAVLWRYWTYSMLYPMKTMNDVGICGWCELNCKRLDSVN